MGPIAEFVQSRQRGGVSVRPASGASSGAHRGASFSSKELMSWNPAAGSADADLLGDLDTLRSRSRDLARNNGIASGVQQTLVDNVVGIGLRLVAQPDYRALGKTKEWAEEWAARTEALWRGWANTFECDAARVLTFAGLTQQVFRAGVLNGEALALPIWQPGAGKYSTRMQLVEADRLTNPHGQMDSDSLRGGVEVDRYGRPLAYHIRDSHPGDWYGIWGSRSFGGGRWERVPAETEWGRRRVIHIHDKERTGQTRGKPLFSAILGDFKMLDHYRRTELQAAIVNSMIAAFIKTPLDSQTIAQMFGADVNSTQYQQFLEQRREHVAGFRGGAMIPLNPGDEVQPFLPSRPAAAFNSFCEGLLREMASAIGIPYELLVKDFSKTNYSSARAALVEAWRFFRGRRHWLATYWATPTYDLWLEEMVNKGLVEAPDFYSERAAYSCAKWIGAGRGWVDPVKEAQAAEMRLAANITTLEDECAEQGLDWEEVLVQRAREQQRMKTLGLESHSVILPPAAAAPVDETSQEEQQVQ
jgi:lambda family phage portal protein